MKILTLGKNFFSNEKRAYSNWREAILKEIAQNGLDSAGCTRMDFDFVKGENTTKIIAKDNGRGMTREILENVFLVLGESKKDGPNPIGGFGVARQLITFAMESYVIRSFDYVCRGSGAMYEIETNKENIRGCIFEIETEHHDWESELKNLLNKSTIRASIFINGEKYENSLHRGRFARKLDFGEIFVNKSATPGLYVRVNGLLMFSKWVNCKAQVCVEIDPAKSKSVLTSNRYGLQAKESAELDEFLAELSADTVSALKDRSRRFVKFMNKTKGFLARITEKFTEGSKEVSVGEMIPAAQIAGNFVTKEILNPVFSTSGIRGESGGFAPAPSRFNCPILESLVIYADTQNENVKKVIKFYDPSENNGEIGSSRHKFIKQWKNICEIVMGELADLTKKEYVWAVGFAFDDEAIAMHQKTEGTSYLMINPVDNEGKMKYSINSKSDITKLTVSSIHEACHAAGYQIHNQDFVCCYDGLLERVMPRLRDVFHAAADAKN